MRLVALALTLVMTGCYFGFWTYSWQGGGSEAASGEEHEVDLPQSDAFILVQDVLRGEGILFEVSPDNSLTTLWKNADYQPGLFAALIGVRPRYRYEMRVVPVSDRKSKIVVNVRSGDLPEEQIADYKASRRFDFFKKFDELAAQAPPASTLPCPDGVNYAVLPNEDLKALAKRVTGSADKWERIAKDNGLKSASEVSAFQTICVRGSLLPKKGK